MPSVVIPPWLDTKPTDFAQASEAGSRLGLERRQQDIAQMESQARMQQSQTEMAANMQADANRIAAQREIASNRMQLATQLAARKFQQQQAYQQAIGGGMDPIDAMMKFGPGMGQSMAGVGQLGLMQQREKMAALPIQFVSDPNDPNRTLGVMHGGQFASVSQPRSAATIPQKMDPGDTMEADVIKKEIETLLKNPTLLAMPGHKDDLKNAKKALSKITSKYRKVPKDESGSDPNNGDKPNFDFTFDPNTGEYSPATNSTPAEVPANIDETPD